MTDTGATATPAAATPAGAPTYVSQANTTDYQSQTPSPAASPSPAATPAPAATPYPTATPSTTPAPTGAPAATPAPTPAPTTEAAKTTETTPQDFKIPDEYKDKPWASKVKSQDDLYKQIDNLTTLVGKKNVVPNLKEASPEEREAFYSQLRGKDASEYQIPDNPSFPTPPETKTVLADLFMKNGVSPVQAEAIIKGYQDLGAKQLAAQFDPEGFKSSMLAAFGSDWEKTTGQVYNTIATIMSPEDQKVLQAIPNNLLGPVYRTYGNIIKAVDATLKKYGASETFAHLNAQTGGTQPTDLNAYRAELRNQLSSLSMRPHEAAEKDAIIQKINDSYKNDPRLQQA